MVNQSVALIVRYRPHSRARGNHHGAFHNGRAAFGIQEGDQRFTGTQRLNRRFGIKGRVRAHGLCGSFDGFLIFWRKGAQGVLDAITELSQYVIGDIRRVLRDKPNADAFGTDQADNLLDLVQQHLRCIVKQQVRFIKEEHQLRLLKVARLWQLFVKFREHPQQAGGVEFRHLIDLL